MSTPKNPLSNYAAYEVRHTLLAFNTTDAACNFKFPPIGLGECGSEVKTQDGKGYVVVNELEDPSYIIKDLNWSFDFFSPLNTNTTLAAGSLTVSDTRGNQFPSFLRRIAKQLGVAESRVSFCLQTVFVGRMLDQESADTITTNPLIFQILDTSTGFHQSMPNMFTMNFVMMFNTMAQMPQYSTLSQFTITNSENSPSKSLPASSSVNMGIVSRAAENLAKNRDRRSRMNKSAPMRTLKELFSGFEAELKDMRFEHKAQLQEFLSIIRPSGKKKLKTPKQKRAKSGEGLPIDFKVVLEDRLHQYQVDNRNLFTEQVEMKQSAPGIESMTLLPGSSLFDAVDELMRTSKKIGEDAKDGYSYKVSASSRFNIEGKLTTTLYIRRYKIPRNYEGVVNTAKGAEGVVKPFGLTYLDSGDGSDIYSLSTAVSPDSASIVLEEDTDDVDKDNAFDSSLREQITFERGETDKFMKSGFSGLRALADPVTYGAQSSVDAAYANRLTHFQTMTQNTLTIVEIAGNPELYSDLARNPALVERGDAGNAKLFKFPEHYPMYLNLTVRLGSSMANGSMTDDDETYWYHTYHYHLAGVTNSIHGGRFTQTLRLLSTDDAI